MLAEVSAGWHQMDGPTHIRGSGKGKTFKNKCPHCNGNKVMDETKVRQRWRQQRGLRALLPMPRRAARRRSCWP